VCPDQYGRDHFETVQHNIQNHPLGNYNHAIQPNVQISTISAELNVPHHCILLNVVLSEVSEVKKGTMV
jgi:hypothetical protein